jgi:hypothetical protein
MSDFNKLTRLIRNYTNAAIAESWAGGGDPADVDTLKLKLKLARLELNTHIAKMHRDSEPQT